MTQSMCERDSDINRLEGEVARLVQQLSGDNLVAQDTIEALRSRIFELEKENLNQRNESAFLMGKKDGESRADSFRG